MEEFKKFDELEQIDERHLLLAQLTGRTFTKRGRYDYISSININKTAPEEIVGQFNILRNLAVYQCYCYAFSQVVQQQSYILIEYALKLRLETKMNFGDLIRRAIKIGLISDHGFRHLKNPSPDNDYCKSLPEIIPPLRNEYAHGTSMLTNQVIFYVEVCADFINQLYPAEQEGGAAVAKVE